MKESLTQKIDRRRFIARSLKTLAAVGAITSGMLVPNGVYAKELVSDAFETDPDQLQGILKKASENGGDFAEIFLEQRWTRRFKMNRTTLIDANIEFSEGTGIRIVDGIQTGYAFVDGFDYDRVREAAKNAREFIKSENLRKSMPGLSAKPEYLRGVIHELKKLESIKDAQRLRVMKAAIESAFQTSNFIVDAECYYDEDIRRVLVATNDGIYRYDYQPTIYVSMQVLAENGRKRHRGQRRISRRSGFEIFDDEAVDKLASLAAEEAVNMLSAQPVAAGSYPVVVASGWGGVLFHEAVGHGLEGDSIFRNASFYTGKVNTRIASDLVTLIDAGNYPKARGSSHIDDEGSPTRETVLIDRGILKTYMTDRISAKQLSLPLTGNARRQSYRHTPQVRMTNTFIKAGDEAPESIIADTSDGLFCKSFVGGMVDTASGNFSFSVREAYKIKNGALDHPVRGAILIGRGSDILTQIDRIGNDFELSPGTCGKGQWVPVTSGQPTLRIASITVGGTE